MSTNCLVTKLKGTVVNDSLVKLGALRLNTSEVTGTYASEPRCRLLYVRAVEENIKVKAYDGGFFSRNTDLSNPMTELTITPADMYVELYFSNANYRVDIENKYKLYYLGLGIHRGTKFFGNVYTSELAYMNRLDAISGDSYIGPLSDIGDKVKFEILNCEGSAISGNIADLSEYTRLITLTLFGNAVNGNISDISNLTNLIHMSLGVTNVGGEIQDFITGQISAGRTTVSPGDFDITSTFYRNNVTIGGHKYELLVGYNYIWWDSASKWVITNGTTSGYQNATTIYAKGATAEEIAAWESAGKTVIVIS